MSLILWFILARHQLHDEKRDFYCVNILNGRVSVTLLYQCAVRSEIQRKVHESVKVPRESSISMSDVQWLLGYILGILSASYVYCVFIAVTPCIMYQFYLKPDCSLFFTCRKAGQKSVSGRSWDRPSQLRFFLLSLCTWANAGMVPVLPSCHYMLHM